VRSATQPEGWGPRTARLSTRRGQAMVEFALLAALLIVLSLGVTDFGRVLGTNATLQNASREAARQVTEYEQQNPGSEPPSLVTFVRTAAQNEIGCSSCLTAQALVSTACSSLGTLTAPPFDPSTPLRSSPPALSMYPTGTDQGFIYACSWKSAADLKQHIEVIITWRASLFTPLMQSIVGQPLLHGIADGTEP